MTSVISNLSSAAAALAAGNIHPHGHGHKRGVHLAADSATDSSSGTAAHVPAGTAQNLFGSMLQSLERVIGVQLSPPASPPAASATTAGPATAGSPTTTGTATAAPAPTATSVSTLLQNYLNNLRDLQVSGSPAAKLAGSNVSVSV